MPDSATALLLDTCALIWIAEGAPISRNAAAALAGATAIFVSPISAFEVGLLSRPSRSSVLRFRPDPSSWFDAALLRPGFGLAPFTPQMAIDAARLPGRPPGDRVDRLVVATARGLAIPVMTRDGAILTYGKAGHVRTIAC